MEGKGRGRRRKDRVMREIGDGRRESSLGIFSSWGCHYSSPLDKRSISLPDLNEGADTKIKACIITGKRLVGVASLPWLCPGELHRLLRTFS